MYLIRRVFARVINQRYTTKEQQAIYKDYVRVIMEYDIIILFLTISDEKNANIYISQILSFWTLPVGA